MSNQHLDRSILIIDDDKLFCDATREYLREPGRSVLTAHTGREGLGICGKRRIDIVLLDQNLPDVEGHTLCPEILEANEQTKIIFITAHPSFDHAVQALRAGAFEYLSKPFEPEQLQLVVAQASRTIELEDQEMLASYQRQKERMEAVLVGAEGGLGEVAKLITYAATAQAPALITGETGTGKNVVAKAIHYSGPRRDKPYISVNCAALPENLIEAELFGHEKGAFTGAAASRKGVFEMAHGGTLFLDEIGEMPLHLQAKLLSVLEDKEFRRLGSESLSSVDVQVVAATAADLEEVLDRTFRRDLYYRLSVMRIHIPPLREHPQDIPALCDHFLNELHGSNRPEVPKTELDRLMAYPWPGNVRELRNILERASILQRGPSIEPSKLLGGAPGVPAPAQLEEEPSKRVRTLDEVERDHIRFALEALDQNYTQTAKELGIAISTLKRKIRRYGLNRQR